MVTVNPNLPPNAAPQASAAARSQRMNVGDTERLVSVLGGGALALGGLVYCPNTLGKLVSAALGGALVYRGISGHCHLYGALNISTAEPHGAQAAVEAGHGVKVEHAIAITKPPQELYQFWRDLSRLPWFMGHLKEVRILDGKRSHWAARGPLGVSVEWDAEIYNERPGELIAWRSLPGSQVDTAGSVHFIPVPGGTEVRVALKYDPPAGKLGAAVARLFGDAPEQQIRADLARFKEIVESGRMAVDRGIGPLG